MRRHCRRILVFTLWSSLLQYRYHNQSQPHKCQETQTWGMRAPFSWSTFLNSIFVSKKNDAEHFIAFRLLKKIKATSFTMLCGWHCWGIVWPLMPGNAAVLAYIWEHLAVWEENRKNSLELPVSFYNCFPKTVKENVISADFTCK